MICFEEIKRDIYMIQKIVLINVMLSRTQESLHYNFNDKRATHEHQCSTRQYFWNHWSI